MKWPERLSDDDMRTLRKECGLTGVVEWEYGWQQEEGSATHIIFYRQSPSMRNYLAEYVRRAGSWERTRPVHELA